LTLRISPQKGLTTLSNLVRFGLTRMEGGILHKTSNQGRAALFDPLPRNMSTISHDSRPIYALPGIKHQTLASGADKLARLEVWMQTLEPGAVTPVHYHECEEVVVILKGSGCLIVSGVITECGPGTTLIILPKAIHQIISTGKDEMTLVVALSETPGRVFAPDGAEMALPWS
jgi:mannose-6-phosphate isomerase-like protein (cupin superfamily)